MGISYERFENIAHKALLRFGTPMYFYHKIDGGRDSVTGETTYNTLITKVMGVQSSFSEIFVDGTNIQKGDKQIVLSTRHGMPRIGDELKIGDTFFKVLNVKTSSPTNIDITYKLHVRSYSIGDDVDKLFVKLGTLEPGALVIDPYRDNTPIWRVVAQNHHKIGVTTLITDKIWSLISFNGTTEIGAAYPSSPWTSTFMRKYLTNEFYSLLTPEMIGKLQGVFTETANEKVTDSISILSKVEVSGETSVGIQSGTHIPYFESENLRIASFDNPTLGLANNTEYWTRDGFGIGADGKVKQYNPAYVHGVRPVIFLGGSIDTVLNYNGEYELRFE